MPYTQYTRAQLRNEIKQSLRAGSYWADAEINLAINEALYLWGAFSQYWRERGTFQTAASEPFYDISVKLPALRPRTATLGTSTQQIQYHLYEPANGVSGSSMTEQFSIGEITSALTRQRNEFILDSKLPFSRDTISPISSPPSGRVSLPDNVSGLGRVSWRDAITGIYYVLRREDGWSEDARDPYWTLEPGIPYAYSAAETKPIEIQLYPPPASSGDLEIVYLETDTLAIEDDTSFAIPDEYSPAVTWGALASVLSVSNEGFDPMRAKYATERYNQIVQAASLQSSILRVQLNDVPLAMDTFPGLDAARPMWRNQLGRPNLGACIFDILALAKVPNSAYGISMDVVRCAPIPTGDSDFIQLGPEEIPHIQNYCLHILQFKLGGAEFAATMPLLDDFFSACAQRSKIVKIQSNYYTSLFGQPSKEQSYVPIA